MKKILLIFLFFISTAAINAAHPLQTIQLDYDAAAIYYEGRVLKNTALQATEIYWPGTIIAVEFEGTSIKTVLIDEKGENYFTLVLDGKQIGVLDLVKGEKEYLLAENLTKGIHRIELHKRNDWTYGKTLFKGFEIKGKSVSNIPSKQLFIEFYGDSITVGYANEDGNGNDRSSGEFTNNYLAYGAITTRNLNAYYSCIAHSGIGIMVSWHDLIMPEEYYSLNPFDKKSRWDFTQKEPDVVVVNLLQNDSWLVHKPENPQFKRRFGAKAPTEAMYKEEYANFVKTIRSKYLKAKIICLLGNMDITAKKSKWPAIVKASVENLNDPKIYTLIIPYKETFGHPRVEEQAIIADKLTQFIKGIL